jgi:hypothetical protein
VEQEAYSLVSPLIKKVTSFFALVLDKFWSLMMLSLMNLFRQPATTWQQYQDSLSLKPVASHIPDIDTHLEHTGTLEDVATTVEEGTPISSDSSESDIPAPHNSSNSINSTPNATSSINLQEGTPDHDTEKDESDHDHIDEDFSTSSHDSQLVPLESTLPEEPQPFPQIIDQGPFRNPAESGKSQQSFKTSI